MAKYNRHIMTAMSVDCSTSKSSLTSSTKHHKTSMSVGSDSGQQHSNWWLCHDTDSPRLAAEHLLCTVPWSGNSCLTTSAHSRTMSLLNRAWKPGCSLGTSMHSALETFVMMRYINLHLPLPLPSQSLTFAPKTNILFIFIFYFIHLTTITYLNMSKQKCNHYLAMHSDKYDYIGVITLHYIRNIFKCPKLIQITKALGLWRLNNANHAGKETENKYVFKREQKTGKVIADVTSVGRLFHKRLLATGKARSPTVTSLVARTTRALDIEERSRRRFSSATRCRPSHRYDGAIPCRHR